MMVHRSSYKVPPCPVLLVHLHVPYPTWLSHSLTRLPRLFEYCIHMPDGNSIHSQHVASLHISLRQSVRTQRTKTVSSSRLIWFRSPLLPYSRLISFLQVLRCFTSLVSLDRFGHVFVWGICSSSAVSANSKVSEQLIAVSNAPCSSCA